LAIALALAPMPSWGAQSKGEANTAPVPVAIVSARKVFISNAGAGCDPSSSAYFKGGPDRPYNQFYAALKSWGRYELVPSPADAELALETSLTCPAGAASVSGGRGGSTYDPQLRLVILDVKTRITLWGITEHVEMALLQSNRDKNFDRAMKRLVDDLKSLAAGSPPPSVDVATEP
jgi:hypothetical protein